MADAYTWEFEVLKDDLLRLNFEPLLVSIRICNSRLTLLLFLHCAV